MHEA
jgi:superfamily II DNA/RNA helicase